MGNRIDRKLLQFWVLESEFKKIKEVIEKQQKICRNKPGYHQFTIGDTLGYIVKEWAQTHDIELKEE